MRVQIHRISMYLSAICTLLSLLGCHSSRPPEEATKASIARGRTIYQTQCISCHNPDPHKTGTLGPEIFGSSKALLQARILEAKYPSGYTPKRSTHIMPALPHLKDEIDSLELFLNQK